MSVTASVPLDETTHVSKSIQFAIFFKGVDNRTPQDSVPEAVAYIDDAVERGNDRADYHVVPVTTTTITELGEPILRRQKAGV